MDNRGKIEEYLEEAWDEGYTESNIVDYVTARLESYGVTSEQVAEVLWGELCDPNCGHDHIMGGQE